jgi:hypothetical protein
VVNLREMGQISAMALEANAKKTEHCGSKNSGHDKVARRADLKEASRKLRRANDRLACEEGRS